MLDQKRYVDPNDPLNPFYQDGSVDYGRVQGTNPKSGGEYPRMLFQPGGVQTLHGVDVDTMLVHNEAEQEAAEAAGWRTSPRKAAALADRLLSEPEPARRGPGRPPKTIAPDSEQA